MSDWTEQRIEPNKETVSAPSSASETSSRARSRLLEANREHRNELIQEIEGITNRTLLCYVSRGALNYIDVYDLDRVVNEVTRGLPITLLLHSPGGNVDAAEKMVHILLEASSRHHGDRSPDLEVVIPDSAKSAATLIALGATSIKMSDSSELGPIDPQLPHPSGLLISAAVVLREYEEAKLAYANEPDNRALADAFSKFDPQLIAAMRQAMSRARTCAEDLLKRQGGNYTEAPNALLDVNRFHSHGQMIDWQAAIEIGIPQVHYVNREDQLWQRYRRLYHQLRAVISGDVRVIESNQLTFIT